MGNNILKPEMISTSTSSTLSPDDNIMAIIIPHNPEIEKRGLKAQGKGWEI
jgi:hypothetical protein